VRDFLRSAGVTATILVEGRGETEPPAYAAGMTYSLDEQRAIARRVELALGG
jgi:outer membrane protein OmpA-like peptidoglycan-associated protein